MAVLITAAATIIAAGIKAGVDSHNAKQAILSSSSQNLISIETGKKLSKEQLAAQLAAERNKNKSQAMSQVAAATIGASLAKQASTENEGRRQATIFLSVVGLGVAAVLITYLLKD